MARLTLDDNTLSDFEHYYMNSMQMLANVIDPNMLYAEVARAGGKTEGITGPRIIRVVNDMPGELSFLVHKSYVALMTNVWPNIQAYFSRQVVVNGQARPMLQYGVDYVVGECKLPSHFRKPRYPITYAKHSVVFRNGAHLQLVSSDQPESVAGRNAVHAFVEEMKHNSGEKLKTRLFPSLRGGPADVRRSAYYEGVTGVSDTARVDLGEDDWFEEYESKMNPQLIEEIATVSLEINKSLYRLFVLRQEERDSKDPVLLEKMRLESLKLNSFVERWKPRLADMRRNAIFYIRASSFCNKDILGPKFFKTQLDTLDVDEFLTAICAIRHKEVSNKFFINYDHVKHQYKDSYRYDAIVKYDLKERFTLTAEYLKHYDPHEPLFMGYDPGNFQSLIVAQKKDSDNVLDIYTLSLHDALPISTSSRSSLPIFRKISTTSRRKYTSSLVPLPSTRPFTCTQTERVTSARRSWSRLPPTRSTSRPLWSRMALRCSSSTKTRQPSTIGSSSSSARCSLASAAHCCLGYVSTRMNARTSAVPS